jgi:hypothetical protein
MNHSGDAAEQIVRMSLEGVEVAARITGGAAKEVALFLIAALKNKDSKLKLKGEARMTSMLKSGKALEIFSIKESDLKKFAHGAKQYGIVYCVLRSTKNSPDGLVDIMAKADDAPKISRLLERFKFSTVDKAKIESDIVAERAARKTGEEPAPDAEVMPEPDTQPESPDINDTDKLLDDLLGADEGRAEPDIPEDEKPEAPGRTQPEPPLSGDGRTQNDRPSEPISDSRKTPERPTSNRPSVKKELREITASKKAQETSARRDDRAPDTPKNGPAVTTHQQPRGGKSKSRKKGQR